MSKDLNKIDDTFIHSVIPSTIKNSVPSSSFNIMVNIHRGSMHTSIRKQLVSNKTNLNKNLKSSNLTNTSDKKNEFYKFESYPILKPDIDLETNLIEKASLNLNTIDICKI